MLFSPLKIQLMLLAAALSATSCGLKIGEAPARDRKIQVAGPGCLDQVGPSFVAFYEGRLKPQDSELSFSCLRSVFDQFHRYARGQVDERSFTPAELKEYIQPFLIKRQVSEELILQFLRVKRAVVGGPIDRLHLADIERFLNILNDLEQVINDLAPHMSLLTMKIVRDKQADQVTPEQLNAALQAMGRATQSLVMTVQGSQGTYNIRDFEIWITEFRHFLGWEDLVDESRTPEAWGRLAAEFKIFSSGGSKFLISPDEWEPFLNQAVGWYAIVLRYQYDLKFNELLQGKGLERLIDSTNQGIDLLQQAVSAQDSGFVLIRPEFTGVSAHHLHDSNQGLKGLFEALENFKLLPFGLTASSAISVAETLVQRVFGDLQIPPNERKSKGLTRFTLAQISAEFERWAEIQKFLDRSFSPGVQAYDSAGVSFESVLRAQSYNDSSLTELAELLKRQRPLFHANYPGIFLVEEKRLLQNRMVHGFRDASYYNLLRAVVRMIFRGYSWDLNRFDLLDAGLTESEFHRFYLDFRDAGIDLKVLDPRQWNAGKRSFGEGNLFTYAADGLSPEQRGYRESALISFDETVQLFAYFFSGGLAARGMYSQMESHCEKGEPDVFSLPRIDRTCAKRELASGFSQFFPNMPGLISEWEKWDQSAKDAYVDQLFKVAKHPEFSQAEFVESGELGVVSVVQHYVESIMTRYNKNDDQVLMTDEIAAALPVFRGMIRMLADTKCDKLKNWQVDEVFWYILRNEILPDRESWWDASAIYFRSFWGSSVELDRAALLRVFGAVIERSSQKSKEEGSDQVIDGNCE